MNKMQEYVIGKFEADPTKEVSSRSCRGYDSILMVSFFIWSGALESPGLLLSYSVLSLALENDQYTDIYPQTCMSFIARCRCRNPVQRRPQPYGRPHVAYRHRRRLLLQPDAVSMPALLHACLAVSHNIAQWVTINGSPLGCL